jgi:hypothetical protein
MADETELEEPAEEVEGVAVLAGDVRAIERVPEAGLPAVRTPGQVAAVAAGGFVAGAVTAVALQRRRGRAARRRGRKRGGGELLSVAGTRSFLVDVHLLSRE